MYLHQMNDRRRAELFILNVTWECSKNLQSVIAEFARDLTRV